MKIMPWCIKIYIKMYNIQPLKNVIHYTSIAREKTTVIILININCAA